MDIQPSFTINDPGRAVKGMSELHDDAVALATLATHTEAIAAGWNCARWCAVCCGYTLHRSVQPPRFVENATHFECFNCHSIETTIKPAEPLIMKLCG